MDPEIIDFWGRDGPRGPRNHSRSVRTVIFQRISMILGRFRPESGGKFNFEVWPARPQKGTPQNPARLPSGTQFNFDFDLEYGWDHHPGLGEDLGIPGSRAHPGPGVPRSWIIPPVPGLPQLRVLCYAIVLPGRNRPSGPDFGRTATGKAPRAAPRPAVGRPEGRSRFLPGSSPAKIRPGRSISGPEALYCVT